MTKHTTGTREQWLAARLELLKAEKELTRRSDELARRRQELPWVRIDKKYRFDTDEERLSGRPVRGARSSSSITTCSGLTTRGCNLLDDRDGFDGFAVHLPTTTSRLRRVAGAAREAAGVQAGMGGVSLGVLVRSDFNADFDASFTGSNSARGIEYNYRREPACSYAATRGWRAECRDACRRHAP